MPLTAYQNIILRHMNAMVLQRPMASTETVVQCSERQFVIEHAWNLGYIAVFSAASENFVSFTLIRLFHPC